MSQAGLFSNVVIGLAAMTGLSCGGAAAMVGQTSVAPDTGSTVMVLRHDASAAGFCTGVALARDVVLTAAHCAPKGSDLRVLLPGDPTKPVTVPVIGVARHPDYHPDAIARRVASIDLALIHLAGPLPETIGIATLAHTAGTRPGARFIASGFGLAREGEPASSGTLRTAPLAARVPLSGVLLWAEDPAHAGTGACTGDSGGPVLADGSTEVSALMLWSAGAGRAHCGTLTQSVWLAPQQPWIQRVIGAWTPNRPGHVQP